MSCHVTSRHVTSRHATPRHVMSCHVYPLLRFVRSTIVSPWSTSYITLWSYTSQIILFQWGLCIFCKSHYCDVMMGAMASQITSLTIVYSIAHSGADQRKHQSPASRAFHRWPGISPHQWPVKRKCFHLMTSSYLTKSRRTESSENMPLCFSMVQSYKY